MKFGRECRQEKLASVLNMKIIFLCGSLEPGRDGVGDYSRRLATDLMTRGHWIGLIALNDKHINEKFDGTQTENDLPIPVLRVPSTWKVAEKIKHAKKWIDLVNPDWLSLQYVIFSFHNKGLPFTFNKLLKGLGQGYNWHIMFHETWVGMAVNDSVKLKLLGIIQKILIKKLIRNLKPRVIHTQCDLFVEQLKRQKFRVKKLPLFSNIEIHHPGPLKNKNQAYSLDNDKIRFVFFGGLHPEAKLSEFFSALKYFEKAYSTSYEFLYIGRHGGQINKHLQILDEVNFKYHVIGEVAPNEISSLLSVSSYGVSTGAPEVLEKSGSVAAMIDHGLPVICIGKGMTLKETIRLGKMNGTYFLEDIEQLIIKRPVIETFYKISDIAVIFINDLDQSCNQDLKN